MEAPDLTRRRPLNPNEAVHRCARARIDASRSPTAPSVVTDRMGIVRFPVPACRCPGHVIDHIRARKEGGADEAWETRQEAKAEHGWG